MVLLVSIFETSVVPPRSDRAALSDSDLKLVSSIANPLATPGE
jgi:hypothetical protein